MHRADVRAMSDEELLAQFERDGCVYFDDEGLPIPLDMMDENDASAAREK